MAELQPIARGPAAIVPSTRKIDYDRGVIIKFIAELGMEVFMYVDEPGTFLSQHGTEVAPSLAKKAGFDVDLLARQREHRRLVALATDSYAKQLSIDVSQATKTVIAERDGFQVVLVGGSRYVVLSPDGEELTKGMPLTEKVALEVLDDVAPAAPAPVLDGRDDRGRVEAFGGTDTPAKAVKKIAP